MSAEKEIEQARLERVCRMYYTNAAAAEALGITPEGLSRRCQRLGVSTPAERAAKQRQQLRSRQKGN